MTPAAVRFLLATAAFACLAGCASGGGFDPSPLGPGSVRTPSGQTLAPQAAMDTITIGASSKADVSRALGRAVVIPFDSGYEVWVYRWVGPDKTTRGATELVVLFEPSGRATKVRIRPGYPPRS